MFKIISVILIVFSGTFASADYYYLCSDYKNRNSEVLCDNEFTGTEKEICEVCREERSCFMAIDNKKMRGLCEAYIEGRSCFMALNGSDRDWCEVINENKACSVLKSDVDRSKCRERFYPFKHLFWVY